MSTAADLAAIEEQRRADIAAARLEQERQYRRGLVEQLHSLRLFAESEAYRISIDT